MKRLIKIMKSCGLFFCVVSLLGEVPIENLKPQVPAKSDAQIVHIYEYYRSVSDRAYLDAYNFLSQVSSDKISSDDFESYFSLKDGFWVTSPERILSVKVALSTESKSGQGLDQPPVDGKLVIGIKRKVIGDPPLVSVEWANSFVDLWIKRGDEYFVIPDAFSFLAERSFSIQYDSRTLRRR